MIRSNSQRLGTIVFLAVISLFLMGCGSSKLTKSNYDLIEVGMKEAVVDALLGNEGKEIQSAWPADGKEHPGVAKSKKWQDGSKEISIYFLDGKVTGKGHNGL
jgi:hypothetical protein